MGKRGGGGGAFIRYGATNGGNMVGKVCKDKKEIQSLTEH